MPLAKTCLRLAAASVLLGASALAPALADPAGSPAASAAAPRVHALYHITWNGLSLGDFTWDSDIKAGQYKAATSANVSALFGAYTWEGATRASGAYLTGQPHPSAYKFRFRKLQMWYPSMNLNGAWPSV